MSKIKNALISVSDKNNLKPILKLLSKHKINIISSGGTYKEIKKLKFKCMEVSEYTQSPEILNGRVKTLHPKIHGGILSKRKNKLHEIELNNNGYEEIDLVIVNFYPFEETLKKTSDFSKIIENIDIGGPAMARSAAKNFYDVTVITSIKQYDELISEINLNKGTTSIKFREKLAQEAFMETSYYESIISNYFNKKLGCLFPKKKVIHGNLVQKLRYGENPHQNAALYSRKRNLDIRQINGKQLSYNNYNDIFSSLLISKSLPRNTGTVIVKHSNPCGVSVHKDQVKSYESALACDPISAFGSIVSCNYKISKSLALRLSNIFLEVVIGNGFEKDAIKILKEKKNLRIIDASNLKLENIEIFSSVLNATLIQTPDIDILSNNDFRVVSKIKPSKNELKNLIFAFNVCRFVKSNAIVIAANNSTIGIGSGQPSRLDSCQTAVEKMKRFCKIKNHNLVAASDAFFPFVDGIEKLVQSGITAIIQPSGSIRDKEIIDFANKTKTILVFSKNRHFRH